MPKAHLLFSDAPLSFQGQAMTCLCGAEVAKAEPVVMVDLSQRPMPEFDANSLRDCAKCIERAERDPRLLNEYGAPGWAGARLYLYAIVTGQATMPGGREWAEREYDGTLIEGLVSTVDATGKAGGK